MAGIVEPLQDILTRAKAMVDPITGAPIFQTVRVWNDQIQSENEGLYTYMKPACFVEVAGDVWFQLAEGVSSADVGIRLHLVHEFYDDQAGNFEQDLEVFRLRDAVIKEFMLFRPTGMGVITKTAEQQDYNHGNVYHYVVEFVGHFIDDTGTEETIQTEGPTDLEQEFKFIEPKNYIIPQ
jgi:hypothetical protein